MNVIESTPEQYRESIQQFLQEYWHRRVWEIEQTVLGIQIPLILAAIHVWKTSEIGVWWAMVSRSPGWSTSVTIGRPVIRRASASISRPSTPSPWKL